ncbi:hypothetical protein JJV70_07030 [Streptomyces sp. JJ66]|uniref:DUF7848 domain-containing protein n=1 Tax=Streptomyces sp. JJ66 TaxID=2803843 RepID=UPI001C5A1E03|nr:hypothetical protein [Streptomyces sp. JJ66]MBW1601866.1 hypothetical protein [Streptomyces sp. JJ66]
MGSSVFYHQLWTIGPDREPDAEPVHYAAECAVCRARSGDHPTAKQAREWFFSHAGGHPEHLTYRLLTAEPYRAWRRNP